MSIPGYFGVLLGCCDTKSFHILVPFGLAQNYGHSAGEAFKSKLLREVKH